MAIEFETTMTEAEFKRPLLDDAEERLARGTPGEVDLAVDGLDNSVLGWLARLFSGHRR
jgi:hypothetical protein